MASEMLRGLLPKAWVLAVLLILAAAAGAAVLAAAGRWMRLEMSRRVIAVFAVALGLLLVAEYLAGPSSYIFWDNEGDSSVPVIQYGARFLAEGRGFAHEWAGGLDPYAMYTTGLQAVLPERAILAVAPLWVAILLHKILNVAIVLAGGALCARLAGAPAHPGMMFAAIAALSLVPYLDHSLAHCVNWAVIFLVVWFFGMRLWQPRPALPMAVMTVLMGLTSPAHIVPIAAVAALAALAFAPRILWTRLLVAGGLIVAANLANWWDTNLAMVDMASLTARGSLDFSEFEWTFAFTHPFEWAGLGALAFLGLRRDPLFRRAAVAFLIAAGCFTVLTVLPWQRLGLGMLAALKWHRIAYVHQALSIVVLCRAVMLLEPGWRGPRWTRPLALATAVLAGILAVNKGFHLFEFVEHGGQVQFARIGNLARPDWADGEPFRTVTLGYYRKPEPSVLAGSYGLDTFDAMVNLVPAAVTDYWDWGIRVKARGKPDRFPLWNINPALFDFDRQVYAAERDVSTRFLGIANVGYLVSPVPLEGEHLTEVSAPSPRPWYGRITSMERLLDTYRQRLHDDVAGFDVFVYRIDRRLPRAFGATGVARVPDDLPLSDFVAAVGEHAPDRVAVMRAADAAAVAATNDTAPVTVTAVDRTAAGYRVSVDAPQGGLVVVNVPYLKFWRASVDGAPAVAAAANQIHTAVPVPAGARVVELEWHRPTLAERLTRRR